MKVREEFAKWLLDIGKYVATAVLITSFLGDLGEKWMLYGFGAFTVLVCVGFGLLIVKNLNKKQTWEQL